MDYYKYRADKEFQGLIEMGLNGHFPLFHSSWLEEISTKDKEKKGDKERRKLAENVYEKLKTHRSFERQQTVLMALPKEERNVFIQSFMKIIENKILDKGNQLQ